MKSIYYNIEINLQLVISFEMRVIHLADIHIKYSRYNEYVLVFNELKKSIQTHKLTTNDFIVVAGDIFDRKDEYTPEEISLFYLFIQAITCDAQIILIPGNHDCIVSDTKMDLISPLLLDASGSKTTRNVIYSKNTEILNFSKNKIRFYHFSCIDKKRKLPDIDSAYTNIALLHETIDFAKANNIIFKAENKRTEPEFSKFDYVMLGDIHQYQIFNFGTKESPVFGAYSSSLIQQNRGEHPLNHGYILWNMQYSLPCAEDKEKLITFIRVKNPTGSLVKLHYADGKLTSESKKLYSMMEVRKEKIKKIIVLADTFDEKKVLGDISNKNSIPITIETVNPMLLPRDNTENLSFEDYILGDSTDKTLASLGKENIIEEYKKICAIFEKNQNDKMSNVSEWKLKYISWKGLCGYDDSKLNYIDFNKLENIVTITGPNASGKSSIIDIIYLTLFNRSKRSNMTKVIHPLLYRGTDGKQNSIGVSSAIFSVSMPNELGVMSVKDYKITSTHSGRRRSAALYKYNPVDDDVCSDDFEQTLIVKGKKKVYDKMQTLIGSHEEFLKNNIFDSSGMCFTRMSVIEQRNTLLHYINFPDKIRKLIIDRLKRIRSSNRFTQGELVQYSKIKHVDFIKTTSLIVKYKQELKNLTTKIKTVEYRITEVEQLKEERNKLLVSRLPEKPKTFDDDEYTRLFGKDFDRKIKLLKSKRNTLNSYSPNPNILPYVPGSVLLSKTADIIDEIYNIRREIGLIKDKREEKHDKIKDNKIAINEIIKKIKSIDLDKDKERIRLYYHGKIAVIEERKKKKIKEIESEHAHSDFVFGETCQFCADNKSILLSRSQLNKNDTLQELLSLLDNEIKSLKAGRKDAINKAICDRNIQVRNKKQLKKDNKSYMVIIDTLSAKNKDLSIELYKKEEIAIQIKVHEKHQADDKKITEMIADTELEKKNFQDILTKERKRFESQLKRYNSLHDTLKKRIENVEKRKKEIGNKIRSLDANPTDFKSLQRLMDRKYELLDLIDNLTADSERIKSKKILEDRLAKNIQVEHILGKIKSLTNAADGKYITTQITLFLTSIEHKINSYLKNLNIKITHNTDNLLTFGKGNDMNSASGFEHFIVSICMQEIIIKMRGTESPISNILFVDEGFGVCDKKNIQIFATEILPRLSEKTRLVLISHNSNINSILNSSQIRITRPLQVPLPL